jgi:myosin-crossreactive antigen
MWCTTFAFQPWHSAVEFKRYLLRFILEFSRIETLAGVKRTVYNQYDSLVLPLQKWPQAQGVNLHCRKDGRSETISVSDWLMSIVLAAQPHFANQPADVQVFLG